MWPLTMTHWCFYFFFCITFSLSPSALQSLSLKCPFIQPFEVSSLSSHYLYLWLFCYNGSQKRPLPEPSYGTLLTSILSPVHPHQCLNIWIIKSAFFSIILVFFVSSVIFQRWTSEAVQISSYLWCLKWKVHRPLRYHN